MSSTENYQEYLLTDYWKAVSNKVKERAGWRCQVCNSKLRLEAHHRTYQNRGNELDHLDDLICLCRGCHQKFHDSGTPINNPPRKKRKRKEKRAKVVYVPAKTVTPNVRPVMVVDHTQVALDMPPGFGDIELTKPLLRRCSRSGMLTRASANALGLGCPPPPGWIKKLNGTWIGREKYKAALEGSYIIAGGVTVDSGRMIEVSVPGPPLPKWGAGIARVQATTNASAGVTVPEPATSSAVLT